MNELLKELERYARSNNKPYVLGGYYLLKEYGEEMFTSFILSSCEEVYIDKIIVDISKNDDLMQYIWNFHTEATINHFYLIFTMQ